MNRDDIIRMAREAGFDPHDMSADFTCNLTDIERFAALVAAHTLSNIDPSSFMSYQEGFAAGAASEREACLKLFDAYLLTSDPGPLRARGDTK